MKTVFNGYGLTVTETEAGGLRFSGTADLDASGVAALIETLRKWRSSSEVERHFARRSALSAAGPSEG